VYTNESPVAVWYEVLQAAMKLFTALAPAPLKSTAYAAGVVTATKTAAIAAPARSEREIFM